jgi:hypothetical protein
MARFRTVAAFYVDSLSGGAAIRISAGRTVADSGANSSPGDIVWTGLNSQSLPQGLTPLDEAAVAMRAASRWGGTPLPDVSLGVDSVDG